MRPPHRVFMQQRHVSGRGEIVLDGFGGSGSTLIAAAKTGRNSGLQNV